MSDPDELESHIVRDDLVHCTCGRELLTSQLRTCDWCDQPVCEDCSDYGGTDIYTCLVCGQKIGCEACTVELMDGSRVHFSCLGEDAILKAASYYWGSSVTKAILLRKQELTGEDNTLKMPGAEP